jgi:hypothetical protein
VLLWLGCAALLVGCGGSGSSSDSSGADSGTTVRIVFPTQQGLLRDPGESRTIRAVNATSKSDLTSFFAHVVELVTVPLAYAQVIPASVARVTLTITGNGFSEADVSRLQNIDIPLSTGRITLEIPLGNGRTFFVQAFTSTAAIAPTFVGRNTVDIPDTGTSVTVTMESTHDPVVRSPGSLNNPGGAVVSLPLLTGDPDGDALSCNVTGLPPGLAFDPTTCLISGTIDPSAEGGLYGHGDGLEWHPYKHYDFYLDSNARTLVSTAARANGGGRRHW